MLPLAAINFFASFVAGAIELVLPLASFTLVGTFLGSKTLTSAHVQHETVLARHVVVSSCVVSICALTHILSDVSCETRNAVWIDHLSAVAFTGVTIEDIWTRACFATRLGS